MSVKNKTVQIEDSTANILFSREGGRLEFNGETREFDTPGEVQEWVEEELTPLARGQPQYREFRMAVLNSLDNWITQVGDIDMYPRGAVEPLESVEDVGRLDFIQKQKLSNRGRSGEGGVYRSPELASLFSVERSSHSGETFHLGRTLDGSFILEFQDGSKKEMSVEEFQEMLEETDVYRVV